MTDELPPEPHHPGYELETTCVCENCGKAFTVAGMLHAAADQETMAAMEDIMQAAIRHISGGKTLCGDCRPDIPLERRKVPRLRPLE